MMDLSSPFELAQYRGKICNARMSLLGRIPVVSADPDVMHSDTNPGYPWNVSSVSFADLHPD